MKKKISRAIYKFVKFLVWLFYPKMKVEGVENLPDEPCIIAANHTQMNGPIACELYFPGRRYTWCAGQMMHLKEVPEYAFTDFWSHKPKYIRWFFKLASYVIAPLSVCVFTNAETIPVYRDARLLTTFRQTLTRLTEGASVVIFPEHDGVYDHIVNDFQDKFVDIAKMYYKRTGKALQFVPMYIAPALKKMYIGKAVRFEPEADIKLERGRICSHLMGEISAIGRSLPEHTVVPYRNIPKKLYPSNKTGEPK